MFLARNAPGLVPPLPRLNRRLPRRLRTRLWAQGALTNLALFARGEAEAGLAVYHPDIEFHGMPEWTQFGLPEHVSGRDAVRRYVEQWSDIYDSVDYREVELIDLGDMIVGRWLLTGTVRGLTTSKEAGHIIRFARDGRVIEQREFATWPDAVAAAGLPPEIAR